VAGNLTSITYTVITGVADVTDSAATLIAGIPAGYSATWEHDLEGTVSNPPASIIAPGAGDRVIVNWTER
jgi:hypothetical protein